LLQDFRRAGGTVIFAGPPPTHLDALPSPEPAEFATTDHTRSPAILAHHQAAHQPRAATHRHRARTTCAPESTAITKRWRCRVVAMHTPDLTNSYPCPYRTVYPRGPDVLHTPSCKGFVIYIFFL
jgi:hypothetical protein